MLGDALFDVDLRVVRRLDQVAGGEIPGGRLSQRVFERLHEIGDECLAGPKNGRHAVDLFKPERPLVVVGKVGGERLGAPESLLHAAPRRIVEQEFRRLADLLVGAFGVDDGESRGSGAVDFRGVAQFPQKARLVLLGDIGRANLLFRRLP